jgi:hypothetical protein
MTLKDNKKITLGLIEEYSPNNDFLTDDEDIRNRLNLVYESNYQYLATLKKILKTKTITISETSDVTTENSLPSDMYQFKRLVALDSNNEEITPTFKIIGKKIYIKQNEGKYIIEYYAYPTDITTETKDNFELELDQEAQASYLPYMVANDILKVDPSADYTAFYREYQSRMETLLNSSNTLPSAVVVEGIL